jgi:hypothetical protein
MRREVTGSDLVVTRRLDVAPRKAPLRPQPRERSVAKKPFSGLWSLHALA